MDCDDVVLPSDLEELEEMYAEEDLQGYWADVLPTITKNIQHLRDYDFIERHEEDATLLRKSSVLRAKEQESRSDDESNMRHSKKRVKACHFLLQL